MPQGAVMPHRVPALSLRARPVHPELVEGRGNLVPIDAPLSSSAQLSLRGAQRRGNLDEVEHTFANRRCYGDEIATLRSQ